MFPQKNRYFVLGFLTLVVGVLCVAILPNTSFADVWSSPTPEAKNVLCIYNAINIYSPSPNISEQICDYYTRSNGRKDVKKLALYIPAGDYILNGSIVDEDMTDVNFAKDISQKILDFLDLPENKDLNITHIAAAKGIPIRVIPGTSGLVGSMSGTNFLSYNMKSGVTLNSLYNSYVSTGLRQSGDDKTFISDRSCISLNEHFDPKKCIANKDGIKYRFAVSYLTAFNLDDVKKLIDKALAPAPDLSKTKWFVDETKNGIATGGQVLSFDTAKVKNGLINSGVDAKKNVKIYRSDPAYLNINDEIVAYNGWGMWKYGDGKWLSSNPIVKAKVVANRAIIDVYESYFGVSATEDYCKISTQSCISQAFSPNVFGGSNYSRSFSGGFGTIDEPYVDGLIRFSQVTSAYVRGLTLAESFLYAAGDSSMSAMVIGDPLMRLQDSKTLVLPNIQEVPTFQMRQSQTSHYESSLEITSTSPNRDLAVSINWGDGSPISIVLLNELTDHSHGVTLKHRFSKFGLYRGTISITDFDGRESDPYSFVSNISPLIEILSPTEGDTLSASQTVEVKWVAPDLSVNDSMVILFYNSDNPTVGYIVDESGVPNTGSYSWMIPNNVVSGNYSVQVSCKACQGVSISLFGWGKSFRINSSTFGSRVAGISSLVRSVLGLQDVIQGPLPSANIGAETVALTPPILDVQRPAPSIEVLAPVASQNIVAGSQLQIRWKSQNMNSSELVLIKAVNQDRQNVYFDLSGRAGLLNTGNFTTELPANIVRGRYRIRIDCKDCMTKLGTLAYAWSQIVTVVSPASPPLLPVITVKTPNGGENYTVGQAMWSISWSSANLPVSTNIDSFQFSLVSSGGASYPLVVVKNSIYSAGFNGNYIKDKISTVLDMKLPSNIPAGQYKLKIVCSSCGGMSDLSDRYFTIVAPASAPSITTIIPSSSQIVSPGGSLEVQWTTVNIDASEPIAIWAFNQNDSTTGYNLAGDTGVLNTGKAILTLPVNMKVGQYKLQLQCKTCMAKFGMLTTTWSQIINVIPVQVIPPATIVPIPPALVVPLAPIISISPSSGPAGTIVTMNVSNYPDDPNNSLTFHTVSTAAHQGTVGFSGKATNGKITFTAPYYTPGTYEIQVQNDINGASNKVNFELTTSSASDNTVAPYISIYPSSGSPGTLVTVNVANYRDDPNNSLDFHTNSTMAVQGGTSFSGRPGTDGKITFRVPDYTYGSYWVQLNSDVNGASNKVDFQLVASTAPTSYKGSSDNTASIRDAVSQFIKVWSFGNK